MLTACASHATAGQFCSAEVLGALASEPVVMAGVHRALDSGWARDVERLQTSAARLSDAAAGMHGAAGTAAHLLASAREHVGSEWTDREPAFRTVTMARLVDLARALASQYEREASLKRDLAADLSARGVSVGACPELLRAYMAAWVMEPMLSDVDGETVDFCVHVIGEELATPNR